MDKGTPCKQQNRNNAQFLTSFNYVTTPILFPNLTLPCHTLEYYLLQKKTSEVHGPEDKAARVPRQVSLSPTSVQGVHTRSCKTVRREQDSPDIRSYRCNRGVGGKCRTCQNLYACICKQFSRCFFGINCGDL